MSFPSPRHSSSPSWNQKNLPPAPLAGGRLILHHCDASSTPASSGGGRLLPIHLRSLHGSGQTVADPATTEPMESAPAPLCPATFPFSQAT
jgi:hypothetical protein